MFAQLSEALSERAEIALIPPISGGWSESHCLGEKGFRECQSQAASPKWLLSEA